MSRHTIRLGRILGIEVDLDYSWFLVFGLLTWLLAVNYYPAEFKSRNPGEYWLLGALTAIMLFVSVLLHELGHSVVAKRYGIPVPRITLFIFGGVSQIASEPTNAASEFWIAIAGPAVSFALGAIFWELRPVFASVPALLALTKYMGLMNLGLGVFNLIPAFPLDGGRVFRAIIWAISGNFQRATSVAVFMGRFFGFLLIFLGVWQALAGSFLNGMWIAFIGWYLENAATSQVQGQRVKDLLAGHKVSEMMSRDCTPVPDDLTLQELVEKYVLTRGDRCFVVTRGDATIGLITLSEIKKAPRASWPTTKVTQAMIPADKLSSTPANAEAWPTIENMEQNGINQLPVVDRGRLIGVFSRDDLVHYLGILQSLRA
ncbi:MAG TPA: site-2 protease family protein [Candidatus Acidoferrum sp.]|nr:site-2 protease family protein [Candidatus Acidoferrum sp.]